MVHDSDDFDEYATLWIGTRSGAFTEHRAPAGIPERAAWRLQTHEGLSA